MFWIHVDSVLEKKISKTHFKNVQLPFVELEFRSPSLIGIQFAYYKKNAF